METNKKKKKIIPCNKNSTKTKNKPVSTAKETVVFLAISNRFRHSLQGVPGPLPLFFPDFLLTNFLPCFLCWSIHYSAPQEVPALVTCLLRKHFLWLC